MLCIIELIGYGEEAVRHLPTAQQTFRCFLLYQELTGIHLSIDLVRLDERRQTVILLAGQEILIEIYPNGNWRFIDES